MKDSLELYIHIPFCVRKCAYCDFLSGPAGEETQRDYVDALKKEIRFCEEGRTLPVSSVFIGGGTPSILPAFAMEEILETVHSCYRIEADAEITMEANPGTLNREKLTAYRRAGINRLSIGCQSTDRAELAKLGRIHTYEEFLENYELARAAGFSNINVDLMSGLPGQTPDSWEESLTRIAKLAPEHISAYSLIVEEGTPFAAMDLDLPDEDAERLMYERTETILAAYGYHRYEISNYAKDGKECRHNKGYWTRIPYLGFGLGSASFYGSPGDECRFSNTRDMKRYLTDSGCPGKIREEYERLTVENAMEETMYLGLRLTEGVDKAAFYRRFHRSIDEIYGDVMEKYEALGLLWQDDTRVTLTRAGISVSNYVLADFLLD